MTDWCKLRVELRAKYRAAAKVAHPDVGGFVEDMAEVNAAYAYAMQEIDRREQEELAQTQAQPKARVNGNAFSTVPEPPPEPRQYPDTTKGRVHRAYDEDGLSGAIKLAKELGVPPRRFKRWHEDFKFFAEWE